MRTNVGVNVSVRGSRRSQRYRPSGLLAVALLGALWLGWWMGKIIVFVVLWIVRRVKEL